MRTPILSRSEIADVPKLTIRWLWHDYLATGLVTLLTSRWKAGKTTLVSLLLSRIGSGEPLAGAPVLAKNAVVVSEESWELWSDRIDTMNLDSGVKWCCRPFAARPTLEAWIGLIEDLAQERPDFVVFDTLPYFLPDDVENNATALLETLEHLHVLTDDGTAVLLLHHPRKAGLGGELSPRGTGALTAFADILLEMDRPPGSLITDRRRQFRCTARQRGASIRSFELAADGREYLALTEPVEIDAFAECWPILKTVFEDSGERLSRLKILKSWPEDYDAPSKATLVRWLERAARDGLVERNGKGRINDPFKYSLPGFVPALEELEPLEPLHLHYR